LRIVNLLKIDRITLFQLIIINRSLKIIPNIRDTPGDAFGFDRLYFSNRQAEMMVSRKISSKVISANFIAKAKQALAQAFAPNFATAVA